MKKIIGIMSLVMASMSFAAATQNIDATLTVINMDEEVTLTIDNHNVDLGNVPIEVSALSAVANLNIDLKGTQAKTGSVEVPYHYTLTDGTNTLDPLKTFFKQSAAPIGGTKSTIGSGATTIYKYTSTANLGDGAGGFGSGMQIPMWVYLESTGAEIPGTYTGTIPVTAYYN